VSANFIVKRRWERTSQSAPVFYPVVNQIAGQQSPARSTELASFRTPTRSQFDTRVYCESVSQVNWIYTPVTQTLPLVPQTGTQEYKSLRTPARPGLDVRAYPWEPDDGWNTGPLTAGPTTAQIWPAIQEGTGTSYMSLGGSKLELRGSEWAPSNGWMFKAAESQFSLWSAVAQGSLATFQTLKATALDVRRYDWSPSPAWILKVAEVPVPSWVAASQGNLAAFMPSRRGLLDVRLSDWAPEPAWIFTNLQAPVTVPQMLPAWLLASGTNYRMSDGVRLDVRSPEWNPSSAWITPVASAAIVPFTGVFYPGRVSYRTPDGPRLDVRGYDWAPEVAAWITVNLPTAATHTIDEVYALLLLMQIQLDDCLKLREFIALKDM